MDESDTDFDFDASYDDPGLDDTFDSLSSSYNEDPVDDALIVDGSFSSTDIYFSDGATFSESSDVEMSDEEGYRSERENDTNGNVSDNIEVEENNEARARYVLRSRRRTRGNVAPIPPSRLSGVTSNSDTEANSDDEEVNDEVGNGGAEDNINENENRVSVEAVEGDNNIAAYEIVDNEDRPLTPLDEEVIELIREDGILNNEGVNESGEGNRQISPVRSRRRPLSEITSGQRSPDCQEKTPVKQFEVTPKAKKKKMSLDLSDCDDDGMTCSVCLDSMTNSGVHRLVSLNCGHLFGKSCVERWLKSGCMDGTRRCPTCNKKASVRDIRAIYAKNLQALDTAERDRIQMELDKVKTEKAKLESDFTRVNINCEMQKKQIESLQARIRYLESNRQFSDNNSSSSLNSQTKPASTSISHAYTVIINKNGGCRVIGFSNEGRIAVSQKSPAPYFFTYGVCVIHSVDHKPSSARFDFHSNAVRDLAFHPQERNQLLTVSLDRTAKISDVNNNRTLLTFNGGNLLWSCTWDCSNQYQFFTGSQNGIVTTYDMRNTNEALHECLTPGDTTPVVSLASIPPTCNSVMSNGGLLSCRLNSVYALHDDTKINELVVMDGPFISLNYNTMSKLLLLSTRPSSRFPNTRHMLSQLAIPGGGKFNNHIHMFTGGKSGQLMSRSCQLMMPDRDVWVGAHNESEHAIQLLSVNRNGPIHTIPVHEPVLDLCPFTINNSLLIGSVSDKSLFVHKVC